jgi:hypothetical protein
LLTDARNPVALQGNEKRVAIWDMHVQSVGKGKRGEGPGSKPLLGPRSYSGGLPPGSPHSVLKQVAQFPWGRAVTEVVAEAGLCHP